MAPNIRVSAEIEVPVPAAPAAPGDQAFVMASEQAQKLRAMIRELHAHVAANTEDVGARFAEEARKIHAGEADDRAIRGRASLEEAIELHEEGIGVLPLPPLPDERN